MKIASFGWECDDIFGNSVSIQWPVTAPIIIRGYQVVASFMAMVRPGITDEMFGDWTEILFTMALIGSAAAPPFGPVKLTDTPAGQHLHGFDLEGSLFCRAILKSFVANPPVANAVNMPIQMAGLTLNAVPGDMLVMTAGHMGYGPIDFEAQGVLFYEDNVYS